MLYPYRPSSVKNRQRWNFGVVYPQAYSEAAERRGQLVHADRMSRDGGFAAELSVKVRFLQAVARTIGKLKTPLEDWPAICETDCELEYCSLSNPRVGGKRFRRWQEASSGKSCCRHCDASDRAVSQRRSSLVDFPGRERIRAGARARRRLRARDRSNEGSNFGAN